MSFDSHSHSHPVPPWSSARLLRPSFSALRADSGPFVLLDVLPEQASGATRPTRLPVNRVGLACTSARGKLRRLPRGPLPRVLQPPTGRRWVPKVRVGPCGDGHAGGGGGGGGGGAGSHAGSPLTRRRNFFSRASLLQPASLAHSLPLRPSLSPSLPSRRRLDREDDDPG